MKLITDKAELVKLIESIASRGKKLDADIQLAGLSCLDHLAKHGDIGQINRLYVALAKGARKAALSSWLLTHGSVVANTEKDKADKPFIYTKDKATSVQAASQDPWYDHKPDAAPDEVFDLQKALEQIVKKAAGKELVHGELLTGVQGLLSMIHTAEGVTTSTVDETETSEG